MTDSSKSALSLISTHKGYSDSEQRIVDYILEHQSEAPRLTAAQLSRAAATSEATVSRFCRSWFWQLPQLSVFVGSRLRESAQRGPDRRGLARQHGAEPKNILAAKVSELNATIDGIDHDTLAAVVHALKNAGVIDVRRRGQYERGALDATFKFSQLGLRCMASTIMRDLDWFRAHVAPSEMSSC